MTVSDYIWKFLAEKGVTHCYYLPGGGSMHLIDALARQDKIEPVAMLHEQACAIASMGHNIYTNTLSSVVCVTTGPGGTNTITGVTAAWIDSTPMFFISGQVPIHMLSDGEERQRGPQEVAIAPLVDRITKHSMLSFGGDYLRGDMEYLYRKAMEAPWGPVWYDIPLDVQGAKI